MCCAVQPSFRHSAITTACSGLLCSPCWYMLCAAHEESVCTDGRSVEELPDEEVVGAAAALRWDPAAVHSDPLDADVHGHMSCAAQRPTAGVVCLL